MVSTDGRGWSEDGIREEGQGESMSQHTEQMV